MKAIEKYFPLVLITLLYNVAQFWCANHLGDGGDWGSIA